MDSSTGKTEASKPVNEKTTITNRKVWDLEQKQSLIVDVGTINDLDFRMVNNHPDGTVFTARDNSGALYDMKIDNGKILKNSTAYTEI